MSLRSGHWLFRFMPHFGYDLALYKGITNLLWRCPTTRLSDNYAEYLSNNHLEIGVGTGYFLKRTACPDHMERLTLLDLSLNCLERSARRLYPLRPSTVQQNILEPFPAALTGYRSVGMNYVLHCLPGNVQQQIDIFKKVYATLGNGGVFFGATLVPADKYRSLLARILMWGLQKTRIFHNQTHTLENLRHALSATFPKVRIEKIGNAVVFAAWK